MKEYRKLIKEAEAAGGRVEKKNAGVMIYGPTGMVMMHTTASDHRALANARSELRKAGLSL